MKLRFSLTRLLLISVTATLIFPGAAYSNDGDLVRRVLPWIENKGISPDQEKDCNLGFSENCPKELVNRIQDDLNDEDLKKACKRKFNATESQAYVGPAPQFEAYLQSQTETRLEPGFGAALNKCLPDKLGSGFLSFSKREPTSDDRKTFVSDYYSHQIRLKHGIKQTTSQLGAIQSLLEEPTQLALDQCAAIGLEGHCRKLNQCKPQGGLENMVADTIYILEKVRKLEFAKDAAAREGDQAKAEQIQNSKEALLALVPWTSGDEFQGVIDRATPEKKLSSEIVRRALTEQLKATRSDLNGQLDRMRNGSECIRGNASCADFDRVMAIEAPSLIDAVPGIFSKEKPTDQDKVARQYLEDSECRVKQKYKDQEDQKTKRIGYVVGAATLVVGGAELIAAKAAYRALWEAGSTQAFAGIGKQAVSVADVSMQRKGIADAAGSVKSDCGARLFDREPDTQGANESFDGCPKSPKGGGPRSHLSLRNCIMAGADSLLTLKGIGTAGAGALGVVGKSALHLEPGKIAITKVKDAKGLSDWAKAAEKSGAEVRIKVQGLRAHDDAGWVRGTVGTGSQGNQFEYSYKEPGFANIYNHYEIPVADRGLEKAVIQVVDRDFFTGSDIKNKAFNISSSLRNASESTAQIHLKKYGTVEGKILDVNSSVIRLRDKEGKEKMVPVDEVTNMIVFKYVEVWSGGK